MMGRRETLVAIVGGLLLASVSAAAFAQAPAASAQQPTATKFITPFKGEAEVEMMPAQARREGNMVVTKFKVKNVSKGPLAGFKVDEFWYNKKGDPVSGSATFRVPKPFMPGDIVEVVLRSQSHPDMTRNIYMFAHQNGKVKPKQVTKFSS